VSPPIEALIARARAAEGTPPSGQSDERLRLQRVAAEFESALMLHVLKEMRRAGRWDEDGEDGGFGSTQAIFEMLDVELASQLARHQSLGLTAQLAEALDRRSPATVEQVAAMSGLQPARSGTGAIAEPPEPEVAAGVARRLTSADVTSAFGWRRDPVTGAARFHRGVDIRAAYGQDVPAAAGGRVVISGSQGSYGTTVVVEHADGSKTRYAHLSVALVREGQSVQAGQLVGRAGSTGRATGPHVHFEVIGPDGNPVDPLGR
jgi:murein DD-endopeptidase MepM/ murein hydrolase activator NlpD